MIHTSVPYSLPTQNCFGDIADDGFARASLEAIRQGNLPLLELRIRERLNQTRADQSVERARLLNALGWVGITAGIPEVPVAYIQRAAKLAPDWNLPIANLELLRHATHQVRTEPSVCSNGRYLLIKAWGCGFWSDVSHVLAMLLMAEVSKRTPVVHWGKNSRFGDGTDSNAFDAFFEPVSAVSTADLVDRQFRIWPPKWNRENLLVGEVNQWHGAYSRLAGLYLFGREEEIVVSDFYTSVQDVQAWIPLNHPLRNMPLDDLYGYLARKYLRPGAPLLAAVEDFCTKSLPGGDFLALHLRGSDKRLEFAQIDQLAEHCFQRIEELRSQAGIDRIFLMTDDANLLQSSVKRLGRHLSFADCSRTNSDTGVHFLAGIEGQKLGMEVARDVFVAVRARCFVGNATSNPSLMVRYLKDWERGNLYVYGPNLHYHINPLLHER